MADRSPIERTGGRGAPERGCERPRGGRGSSSLHHQYLETPRFRRVVLIPDLTRVHLGRIEHDPAESWRLEVLVVEAAAPPAAARPFTTTLRRAAATRPFDR